MGWGEGEDLGDQFSLILTPARPDTPARSWPEGRKGKERRNGEGEETVAALLIDLLLLHPARLHRVIRLSPLPKETPGRRSCCWLGRVDDSHDSG